MTLAELKRRNVTTIVVAHRPAILATIDKILALRDGSVENFGTRAEVIQRYTAAARPAARSASSSRMIVRRCTQ